MRRKILVFGLGVSGSSVAAFLLRQNSSVFAVDRRAEILRSDPSIRPLLALGMELVSEEAEIPWAEMDRAILSPGVPLTHPLVQRALTEGIEVLGEVEFALRLLSNRCIAITGTNGKTTTVRLVEHILRTSGRKAQALGNVGKSMASYLLEVDPEEWLVVELSSFQLETLSSPRFDAGLILNIAPNHLVRHGSVELYAKAKARLERCLKKGGKLWISEKTAREFGSLFSQYEIFDGPLAPISKVGYTQRGQNERAAFALSSFLGISEREFQSALGSFQRPPHRIEFVAESGGVSYYNDSKATNVDAVIYAVEQLASPIVLLAGGVDKGAPYAPWIEVFRRKVKRIIAFGQAAPLMQRELAPHFPFLQVASLEQAVTEARKEASFGDAVLLSPGCSSFDQFRNYEHRGEEFKRIVVTTM